MAKTIPLKTAKAALAALNLAADWIAIGEQGNDAVSWFTEVPAFDRRRKALEKAIAKAEAAR